MAEDLCLISYINYYGKSMYRWVTKKELHLLKFKPTDIKILKTIKMEN